MHDHKLRKYLGLKLDSTYHMLFLLCTDMVYEQNAH